MFKNPCGKTALTMLSLCAVPEFIAGMKPEEFVDSIRREFKGRAPKVQKLHTIHSIAWTSIGIGAAAESVSVELLTLSTTDSIEYGADRED